MKIKNEKGITLVALIITIVVLLILATVAVSSIENDGIIQYATNAGGKYNQSVANEQLALNQFENYLNNATSTQKIIISFTIEETTYQAEEGMTWEAWVESKYNPGTCYVSDGLLYYNAGVVASSGGGVSLTDTIESGASYATLELAPLN